VMVSGLLLLLLFPSSSLCVSRDSIQSMIPELQGLAETLPVLVTMLLSGPELQAGELSEAMDEWLTATIPELRRLVGTFSTLTKMMLKLVDKTTPNLDQVEVETAQLIFKGLFVTGEEIIMTVIPVLDILPDQVKNLVSKKSIINLLNIDFFKKEILNLNDDTVKILVIYMKSIPIKEREDGLALLKLLENSLKLAEEDGDDSQFEDLFSQLLNILPRQVQHVQDLVKDFSLIQKLKKKSVILNRGLRHEEL